VRTLKKSLFSLHHDLRERRYSAWCVCNRFSEMLQAKKVRDGDQKLQYYEVLLVTSTKKLEVSVSLENALATEGTEDTEKNKALRNGKRTDCISSFTENWP
jgi:hypothetical protein